MDDDLFEKVNHLEKEIKLIKDTLTSIEYTTYVVRQGINECLRLKEEEKKAKINGKS